MSVILCCIVLLAIIHCASSLFVNTNIKNFKAKFNIKSRDTFISSALMLSLTFASPAFATDLNANGAKLFESSCNFCHAGGGNLIPFSGSKTLDKAGLEANGYKTKADLISVINNGQGAMPAFGPLPKGNLTPGRFTVEQVSDVADFVLYKAENGWK